MLVGVGYLDTGVAVDIERAKETSRSRLMDHRQQSHVIWICGRQGGWYGVVTDPLLYIPYNNTVSFTPYTQLTLSTVLCKLSE